jgi:hypothetical protein
MEGNFSYLKDSQSMNYQLGGGGGRRRRDGMVGLWWWWS